MATYTPSTGPGAGTPLAFHLLIDPPERDTQQQMAERTIRGATNSVVSFIGKAVTKIRGEARFDSFAGFKTFEGVVGTEGSLIYSEEPSGITVIFVAMRRNRVTPHDVHLAQVEFWIIPTSAIVQIINVSGTIGGNAITNILSARVSYGFDMRCGECQIVTPSKPTVSGSGEDNAVSITIGTASPAVRFVGVVREFQFANNPPSCTTVARGYLTRAIEYENSEETAMAEWGGAGGLMLPDLVGANTGSSSGIVQAVLNKAGLSGHYSSGNIDGSSWIYGGGVGTNWPMPFLWRSGGHIQVGEVIQHADAGETAMSYIERYDAIDVKDSGVGGRLRTFEDVGGTIRRKAVGGRPSSGTPAFTLTGGIDILAGQFKRSITETRNYFVVKGQDRGNGFGPLNFALQESNDFQPDTEKHSYALASDMIERDTDADTTNSGISCETICNALAIEFNREFVTGWLETYRDDLFLLGQTHLVQGAIGGLPGDLGVAENLWVQSIEISVDERGFTQRMTYLGGGL
jgi:hypothetical protein